MFSSEALKTHLHHQLDTFSPHIQIAFNEVTLSIASQHYYSVCENLRDDPICPFKMMIDLCGVDYLHWPDSQGRFAIVLHLLSLEKNCRLRIRCFCTDDDRPSLPSIVDIWPTANWFEREAFDLFGIVFRGHPDLRRILTDYGFSGHPFRKDFPVSGYVEMHYDEKEKRVAYQPVTIEPRMNVPRIVRADNYAYPVKEQ